MSQNTVSISDSNSANRIHRLKLVIVLGQESNVIQFLFITDYNIIYIWNRSHRNQIREYRTTYKSRLTGVQTSRDTSIWQTLCLAIIYLYTIIWWVVLPEAGIKGRDNRLHTTDTVGCNDLLLSLVPASNTTVLVTEACVIVNIKPCNCTEWHNSINEDHLRNETSKLPIPLLFSTLRPGTMWHSLGSSRSRK